jgi:hypothetical protein
VARRGLWIGIAGAVAASGAIIAAVVILTSGPSLAPVTPARPSATVISGTPNPLLISLLPVPKQYAIPSPACFDIGGPDLVAVSVGHSAAQVGIIAEAAAKVRVTKVFLTVSARQISPAAYTACAKTLPSPVKSSPAVQTVVLRERGVVPLPDLPGGGSYRLNVRIPARSVRAPVAYIWYVSAEATSIYGLLEPHSDTIMTLAPPS